jgi:hypothetical protein
MEKTLARVSSWVGLTAEQGQEVEVDGARSWSFSKYDMVRAPSLALVLSLTWAEESFFDYSTLQNFP